ncbi:hypothetical protein OFO12_07385, partial [Campylobacter sp. JMF_04 NA10]|uniref:hypothetical protein n=1 Tax=Campylobacter sp. JMF_04 NA10 TaxID=2983824 RepID=UPI0022E9FD80
MQSGYSDGQSSNSRLVDNNSIEITNSTFNGSIWAARTDSNYAGSASYNTTLIEKSTITHKQLRGAISYPRKGKAEYNTLYVKDSTMFSSNGESYEITGAIVQEDKISGVPSSKEIAFANYNQLIYDGVTTFADSSKNSTSKYLFGGVGKFGEANNNRIYVKDLNKDADDNAIATNISAGTTWRPNSGGAEGNIAVAVGESKISNIYGGAVGLGGTEGVGKSNGANSNLVILDLLENKGKVKENIYGGYISDTTSATTKNNAVFFLNGNVLGAVIGGNAKEITGNTLILGDSTSTWGTRKAGQISNFENLNFNVLQEGD